MLHVVTNIVLWMLPRATPCDLAHMMVDGHLMCVWWPRTYEIRVYSLCAISSFIYSCTVMDRAIEIGSEGRSP